MFTKATGNYMVLDDTLILYKGTEKFLLLPASIDGQQINTIGAGAVYENNNVLSIRISEGVKNIGENALSMLGNLNRIYLPETLEKIDTNSFSGDNQLLEFEMKVHISGKEYEDLLNNSYVDSSGFRIIDGVPAGLKGPAALGSGFFYGQKYKVVKYAASITRDMESIFFLKGGIDQDGSRVSFSLNGAHSGISMEEDIQTKIRDINKGIHNCPSLPEVELFSDDIQREDRKYDPSIVLMAAFDQKAVDLAEDKYEVDLKFMIGTAFWIAVRPMMWEGKRYYYTSLCYLTCDEKCPYVRVMLDHFYREDGTRINEENTNSRLRRKSQFLNII